MSTTSETLDKLWEQEEWYNSSEQEEESDDIKATLKRYIRKVFRQVKFFTESDSEFKTPDFVVPRKRDSETGEMVDSQIVQICDYFVKNICKLTGIVFFCIIFYIKLLIHKLTFN